MVYLTKAEQSPLIYDNWICGGAIVSPFFIVTSGACVEDVQFMYAVAGYDRYVKPSSNNFTKDDCIKSSKKKVVFTCTPKNYEFAYNDVDKWSNIDIAVVKVESPYDFDGEKAAQICSWVPGPIDISFDYKHSEPGRDAMVLGWGHSDKWRKVRDNKDYNSEKLKYAAVQLLNKTTCKSMYKNLPDMAPIIDKYMICSDQPGGIDDGGNQIQNEKVTPLLNGCIQKINPVTGRMNECVDEFGADQFHQAYDIVRGVRRSDNFRTNNSSKNNTNSMPLPGFDYTAYTSYGYFGNYSHLRTRRENDNLTSNLTFSEPVVGPTRRHGICQNDHGGPLVTWVGSQEILIGAASVFLVNNNSLCIGPYLYTSTQCNGAFLGCVLEQESTEENMSGRRNWGNSFDRRICHLPPQQRGFELVERRISWLHHPDGPAANEMPKEDLFERPQLPLRSFNDDNIFKQQENAQVDLEIQFSQQEQK
ncbi:uncharacterized protein LOC113232502 [Hyposmocoma kahamanoa]|uniref:uncharacterized protein LOC113232502 n=1 Tax=Hyposmocoma kahamanoa TaxID=1477025 RepID=UPI000E6D65BF|nr:uncharacterized protein LOC113232502 [Hyposmocoma kahamanoa]XP_026323039.1 uncharacterized protein LOC113232502 [Hyposmocoma kahamanoa]